MMPRFARLRARFAPDTLSIRTAIQIVLVLSLALYASSLWNHFAYDDVAVVRDDTRVHSLKNLPHIFETSYWNNQGQALYRPLVTSSFDVDWAIAKDHPGWFHFTNVLWNAGACVLVFLVLAELFAIPAALAGALIFVVHPVHVEAVANVVGRAELMAAVFTMGAALLWMRSSRERVDRMTLLFTVPALFFLGVMCKESAIMLPPLLVLFDIAQGRLRRGGFAEWLRARALPMLAIAITGVLYLLLRSSVLHIFGPSNLDAALEVAPAGMPRVLTALQVWLTYLRLFIYPRVLLADYGPRILLPATTVTRQAVAGFLIFAGCVVGGCIAAWRGNGRTALALLWAPVAMLPVSNLLFPIGILVAERTLYLPLFAMSIGVAAAVTYAPRAQWLHQQLPHIEPSALVWTTVLVVCTAFSVRTLIRIPDWKTTQSIFRALITSRPDSFRAQWHLARVASDSKDPPKALAYYSKALMLWPYRARLIKEASGYAVTNGELAYARNVAAQGVRVWPLDPDFRRSLAGISLDLGDTAQAVIQIREGLKLAPDDSVMRAMRKSLGQRMDRP